jgi:CspA family cold shock protein
VAGARVPPSVRRGTTASPIACEDLDVLNLVNSFGGEAMAALNGTIKRLVTEKGFGFIATSDGTEYFFHSSACTQTPFGQLREGQAVTFERGQGPKGPRGENVRPA